MGDLRSGLLGVGLVTTGDVCLAEKTASQERQRVIEEDKVASSNTPENLYLHLKINCDKPADFRKTAKLLLLQDPTKLIQIMQCCAGKRMQLKTKAGGDHLYGALRELKDAFAEENLPLERKKELVQSLL